ncbi:MAG: ABC transporter ATP-binding protein [Clostridiales bacterium]|jgi:ABC-2 type transport system ATP-binding protein|nr:ABC transporter ATP-binding protein [Clostridiales bacterium]
MIEIIDLCKQFSGKTVVDHVNLNIENGEFLSLLGPNGAGKTTLINMMTTLLLPDAGKILIDGEEVSREKKSVKKKLSIISQEYSLRNDFTVLDIMEQHGRLYNIPKAKRREKTAEVLELCGLSEAKNKTVRQLSGGMKRKLMLCRALITEPEYLILDEPTVGLDPMSRRQIWSVLYKLNEKGMTILLTTHYIEEAQYLSKKVALINKGKIKTVASPDELIRSIGNFTVDIFHDGEIDSHHFMGKEDALAYIAQAKGRTTLRETNLEDVFIAFAGKGMTDGHKDSTLGKVD